jgi:hypothetical protein
MKTLRFTLHNLWNEEFLNYLRFLIRLITGIGAEKLGFVPLLAMLEKNADAADSVIEIIGTQEHTRRCNEVDEKRDRLIGSTNSFVRSFLYDEDDTIRAAAESIMLVIDHYAGMAEANRDQESNMIVQFVGELTDNYGAQVAKIEGLAGRIEKLSAANSEYISLHDERNLAIAAQGTLRMVNVRRDGEKAIRSLWDLTDISLLSNATPEMQDFVAQLNTENQAQRTKLNIRKGRK